MTDKMEKIAAALGMNPDVAEKLDRLLQGPGDRAYVVCNNRECTHNDTSGYCTIYTVTRPPERNRDGKCSSYLVS